MPRFRVRIQVKGHQAHVEQLVDAKDEREAFGHGHSLIVERLPTTLYRAYRWEMLVYGLVQFEISISPELPTIDSKADVA